MVEGAMPSREAVTRSINQRYCQAAWLLVRWLTSSSSGQQLQPFDETAGPVIQFIRIGSLPVHTGIGVRLTRSSTVMSCTGSINNWMP